MVGTALIAVSSPLFVRSYLPLRVDPIRQTLTLQPGGSYRWRSEGYATTAIGPLGMPGKTKLPAADDQTLKVALWGDSQAEGSGIADDQKLFARIEEFSAATVFPLARSGEGAAIWLTQMPKVESHLRIEAHVFLIVDLPDLLTAVDAPLPTPSENATRVAVADWTPAFLIQVCRNLLMSGDDDRLRTLRFGIGPIRKSSAPVSDAANASTPSEHDWNAIFAAIRSASTKPIVILCAPKVSEITGGTIGDASADLETIDQIAGIAAANDIRLVNVATQLQEVADRGDWPYGFHNGQIGAGHLNASGYAVVAAAVAEALDDLVVAAKDAGT